MMVIFSALLLMISVYTWGFVDPNAPFLRLPQLVSVVYQKFAVSSIIYASSVALLFIWYGYLWLRAKKDKLSIKTIIFYLVILIAILFFSYPAFSNDIFNYIATAKVTFLYHENPYIVMPIDIRNEPMLTFLQAANKTALYGPTWILITLIPYVFGFGHLLLTVYMFKFTAVAAYLVIVWLIWKLTRRELAVVLFAFNPLVIIDTLIDAHNDVAMMALALGAFYLLRSNRYYWSVLLFVLSFFVKGATIFLLPVYVYTWMYKNRKSFNWEAVWLWSSISMFVIFMLSPLREEIYSWYFIWVLTFIALRKRIDIYTAVAIGFSFGLPLRFLPFVYTREWGGVTPVIKKFVTFVPPAITAGWYLLRHYRDLLRR